MANNVEYRAAIFGAALGLLPGTDEIELLRSSFDNDVVVVQDDGSEMEMSIRRILQQLSDGFEQYIIIQSLTDRVLLTKGEDWYW